MGLVWGTQSHRWERKPNRHRESRMRVRNSTHSFEQKKDLMEIFGNAIGENHKKETRRGRSSKEKG